MLCAYIARYATERPDAINIYGDFETGYIVTPTLPPDLCPAPRQLIVVAVIEGGWAPRKKMPGSPAVWNPSFGFLLSWL